MATVDELLELAEMNAMINDKFVIEANSRKIYVPSSESIFGVEEDKDSERKYFTCPKVVGDNVDLSTLRCKVNYVNANGESGQYLVEDVVTNGNFIEFSWLISEHVCAYRGTVTFLVVFEKALSETEYEKVWHTTIANGSVIVGLLGVGEQVASRNPDIIEQILLRLDNMGGGGSGGGMTTAERNQLNKNTQDISSLNEEIANLKNQGVGSISNATARILCDWLSAHVVMDVANANSLYELLVGSSSGGEDTPTEKTLTSITVSWKAQSADVGTSPKSLINYVQANYSDGSSVNVSSSVYTVTPTVLAEGNNNVVVSYGGKTATKTIVGNAIASNPITVSYSGTIATINNLKNRTVSYNGTVANVGV